MKGGAKLKPLSVQIYELMVTMRNLAPEKATPELREKILGWTRDLPPAVRPLELLKQISVTFKTPVDEVIQLVSSADRQKVDFEALLPSEGWLADYYTYTLKTEPPSVFHFFAGVVAISSAIRRNVCFPRGSQLLFPNIWVVLVAPSGKCRKTTACDIAVNLFRGIGGEVLADKLTPEAITEAYRDQQDATGLIYAPELAVFLGKQRYNEGMIPLLTAFSDCPSFFKSKTIMRGDAELRNIGFTFLGASTIDWIQTAIPKDSFGGGFMSRLLFVVQEDTPRRFALPPPLPRELEAKLLEGLRKLTHRRGQFTFQDEAHEFYTSWYNRRLDDQGDNKHFSGYSERKPTHVLKLAMVLALSEGKELVFTVENLERSIQILDWLEELLPATFAQIQESSIGADQLQIVAQLKKRGGAEKHSSLLRANVRKMNSIQFKQCMETLRAGGLVDYDEHMKTYYLTPEGWKA